MAETDIIAGGKKDNTFELEDKQRLNVPEQLGYGDKVRGETPMTIKTENPADVARGFGIVANPTCAPLPPAKPCKCTPWKPPGRK